MHIYDHTLSEWLNADLENEALVLQLVSFTIPCQEQTAERIALLSGFLEFMKQAIPSSEEASADITITVERAGLSSCQLRWDVTSPPHCRVMFVVKGQGRPRRHVTLEWKPTLPADKTHEPGALEAVHPVECGWNRITAEGKASYHIRAQSFTHALEAFESWLREPASAASVA